MKAVGAYVFLVFLIAVLCHSSAFGNCFNNEYSLPAGTYLNQLKAECETAGVEDVHSCVVNQVEYNSGYDELSLPGRVSQQLPDSFLPVALADACYYVKQGFDIRLSSALLGKTTDTPVYKEQGRNIYNTLLLHPNPRYLPPLWSELTTALLYQRRVHTYNHYFFPELKEVCKKFHPERLSEDLVAYCQNDQGGFQWTRLPRPDKCWIYSLDVVVVNGELYCLHIPRSLGLSIAKLLSDEVRINSQNKSKLIISLINSSLSSSQVALSIRHFNSFMWRQGRGERLEEFDTALYKNAAFSKFGLAPNIRKAIGGENDLIDIFNLYATWCVGLSIAGLMSYLFIGHQLSFLIPPLLRDPEHRPLFFRR